MNENIEDDKKYLKIYSLNLMAFLVWNTKLSYKLHSEYDPTKGFKYYGIFEDTEELRNAMNDYKNDEWLKGFLDSLKDIIDRKNNIQRSVDLWNKS